MRKPTAIRAAAVALVLVLAPVGPALAAGESAAIKAQEAASALLRGQIDQAVAAYTEALQDASLPNDRRAAILNDRGVANTRLGQHKLALDDYNRAVQLFPEYAPVYNNRGNTLLGLGLPQEALKDFDRAIALAPGYAAAYNNRAGTLLRLGQGPAAIRDYTRAVKLMPQQGTASLTGRGRALLRQDRPHAAMRDFSRAIAADGRSASAYRARAAAAMELERFEEAIEDLSRAIAFEPDNAEMHVERGHAYRFADNAAAAIRDFTRALEIDPRSSRALASRGLALGRVEAYEEAEADLAKAIEIDPRSVEAFAYRAWLYKQTGQPELGLREVEKALRIRADDADVQWAKGEVELALGRTDDAIASFRKALSLKPAHRDARAALQHMAVAPDATGEIDAAAIAGWRVVSRNGRYIALLEENPNLRVPLEMAGEGEPRLIDWELKDGPLKGIGLLRYQAGVAEGRSGPEPVEQVAIVDLAASRVVSLQLHRQGEKFSNWIWNEGTVTIESIDGLTDVIELRAKPREVAQRRPVNDRGDFGGPSWAPWNQGWEQPAYAQRGQQQRRRKPPKTLFDLLFGN
ncbi:MAG: tetratricopeptide repeat protein [Hyphomicrobiaceae bacterium]|nr:tetratricopeptide repeat protein [Hyphomicrobiaceae bacterium]